MKLPFLRPSSSSWPWPSCTHSKTLSFRADVFKTINTAFLDATPSSETQTPPESWFTNSSESSASFSTASADAEEASGPAAELTETEIRGLVRSERLFFEPGGETNSILEEAKAGAAAAALKESLIMSVESRDPYSDFRESMEEMVEAHGIREWENLEELLGWYLKVNGKQNHQYIVGAFMDLLVGLAISAPIIDSDSSISTDLHNLEEEEDEDSPSSPLSFYTSFSSSISSTPTGNCGSNLELGDDYVKEIQEIEDDDDVMMEVHVV